MEATEQRLDQLIHTSSTAFIPEWGERAIIIRGSDADVICWDFGNSWLDILHVVPKNKPATWLPWFFSQIIEDDGFESEDDIESDDSEDDE
jgi:hypothetical protein